MLCRIIPSQLKCLSYRKLKKMTKRSEAGPNDVQHCFNMLRHWKPYLCSYIGYGTWRDMSHAVDTSVTWSHCFILFLYWARRGKDMLKGLHTTSEGKRKKDKCLCAQTRSSLQKSPSQGASQSNFWLAYTNNGHWSPWTAISPLVSLAWILHPRVSNRWNT